MLLATQPISRALHPRAFMANGVLRTHLIGIYLQFIIQRLVQQLTIIGLVTTIQPAKTLGSYKVLNLMDAAVLGTEFLQI